ncbi:ABC transporter ATP-binding protein [Planctomycetales bacterium]|nr:ABC transporter ATP-binding protein [Planctomycetales bacterium]
MPLISVKNLSMQFGNNPVLRDVSFSVEQGESVAIIGESGCGKTVLLKTLIGLHWQTSGQVLFDDYDLSGLSYLDLAKIRTRFGFVFQQAALFDSMTIEENVAFPLVQHTKKTAAEIRTNVARLLNEVGLDEKTLLKKPAELSGGMRKRVGVARALALKPELILYDEPTTGLDPVMSDVINDLMLNVKDQYNVTSIMVTHDLRSAHRVADRIIMLAPIAKLQPEEPQIVFDGSSSDFFQSDNKRVLQFVESSI